MGQLVRAGMEAGAFGLSSGLYYTPGSFATTEEVIDLARQIAPHGGIYASHIRDEGDFSVGLVAAVDEVIRVAREARVRGVVTHIKALGRGVWGMSAAVVRLVEEARAEGVEVFADQYPYEASATSLIGALVPPWAQAGGREELHRRIRDGAVRERIAAKVGENIERRGGAGALVFRRHEKDPSIEGRTLEAVATERGLGAVELALALILEGNPGVVSFNMDEGDVRRFMAQPWVMTSTDGDLVPMGEGVPHPRSYGAFPRKIHTWVLEKKVLDLAFAVRSMTSLPATVFRIPDRGLIRPGARADILVFDLAALEDTATYTRPHQIATGMRHVLVNGEAAIVDGDFTDGLHGRVLSPRVVTPREP